MNDPTEPPPGNPTGSMFWKELMTVKQLPRLLMGAPKLLSRPKGNGVAMAIPGYGTNDSATLPLRAYLRTRGHHTIGWGMGINKADVEKALPSVIERVERLVDSQGDAAVLIGWSMGGVFAREVARDRPDLVREVVTFGTPVVGGPKHTRSARFYSSDQLSSIGNKITDRNLIPIDRPITAIWSRNDGVVDWRACIDDFSPHIEHVEVQSTHIGMLGDPDVWHHCIRSLT